MAGRLPLFNPKLLDSYLSASAFEPTEAQLLAAQQWSKLTRSDAFHASTEKALQSVFKSVIAERVLLYTPIASQGTYTVSSEESAGSGFVDLAFGSFATAKRTVVAPLELKGPKTKDLDAILPSSAESPVQQAWRYAIDIPGSRWVLVSNMVELRLYAFGHGRDRYEVFDLSKIDQPEELRRLCVILSSGAILGGATAQLLEESERVEAEITDKLYSDYKTIRDQIIEHLNATRKAANPVENINLAQLLLDRILFIAFCEDTGLLPKYTIRDASEIRNKFSPQPLWTNFVGLFQAVDKGASEINIPAYNGGLFASDLSIDELKIPDSICKSFASLAAYDFSSEVSVRILGHILEQSISDIEAMHAKAKGLPLPTSSIKKREGVVYTPEFVTEFIVEKTIGHALQDKFNELLPAHKGKYKKDGAELEFPNAKSERAFWSAYQEHVASFTVVDPACGSGAFLIAAFDFLHSEYRRVNSKLAELAGGKGVGAGQLGLFDPDKEILSNNLYGVDVNSSSVEITKLSLWLKTAKRGKLLQGLDANIICANSLELEHGAFKWETSFPKVFQDGGFSVVLGNPPYVRMELIKPYKALLEKKFKSFAPRADLYTYFYEKGLDILKPDGRLGFISSNTFFRTAAGKPLRELISASAQLQYILDFRDNQIFEGVTTYPVVTIMKKTSSISEKVRYVNIEKGVPPDLASHFDMYSQLFSQADLKPSGWLFEVDELADVRQRLFATWRTLGDVYGPPLYGIKTGLNDAFVIDAKKKAEITKSPKEATILKPFLRGEDVKRWGVVPGDLYLINTPKGVLDITHYPETERHLNPFRSKLVARATKQEWYELQQAQLAYQSEYVKPKIIYPHFQNRPLFAFDDEGYFGNDKTYCIPTSDLYLLGLLNSSAIWFLLCGMAPPVRGGYLELRVHYMERLPIPDATSEQRGRIGNIVTRSIAVSGDIRTLDQAVRKRILDLALSQDASLGRRLREWSELTFKEFCAEIKSKFKHTIPVAERGEWEEYISAQQTKIFHMLQELVVLQVQLDECVFDVFGLSPGDRKVIQSLVGDAFGFGEAKVALAAIA